MGKLIDIIRDKMQFSRDYIFFSVAEKLIYKNIFFELFFNRES
jgi:hypothetical protein